jgi:4-diphosphocytidyl-2-C-methyl-D-erythritol kinase
MNKNPNSQNNPELAPESIIEVVAPAKLNFTFEIVGLLDDGYHEVRTLMSTIDLSDKLRFSIRPSREPAVNLTLRQGSKSNPSDFPLGSENLIAKAVRLYLSAIETPRSLDINVEIKKNIPIGAGMAGGSANAAAALLAMNQYFKGEVSQEKLFELAARLGADVPFCLSGGLRAGSGRGDVLGKAIEVKPLNLVIAKPRHLAIATPWVYQTYDQHNEQATIFSLAEKLRDRQIIEPTEVPGDFVARNLASGTLPEALKGFGNDFEQVVFPHYQELKEIKQTFLKLGALACHMTGSGPTIYAVTESRDAAEKLKHDFYQEFCQANEIACATKYDPIDLWVTQTIENGAQVLAVISPGSES